MIDWWVGTVILTFFPILTSIIINICRNGYADFNRMVGDGELILSAFLVITPSVMNYFKADFNKKDQVHKKIFYLLLFVAFFELTTYTTIKTNPDNIVWVVYIASIICTVSSIIISWQSELFFKKKGMSMKIVEFLLNNLLPIFFAVLCLIAALKSIEIVKRSEVELMTKGERN